MDLSHVQQIPPISILPQFLSLCGTKAESCRIRRTDKGGELWKSTAFRQVAHTAGYLSELKAPDPPFQNSVAKQKLKLWVR